MSCQRREQEKQPTDQADDKTRLKSIIKPLKIKIQSRFQRDKKEGEKCPANGGTGKTANRPSGRQNTLKTDL